MQKNNLCPLSNKILTYEESDSFSQSTFKINKLPFGPSKTTTKQIKQKFISNISNKINQIHNNNININKNSIPKKIHSNNYIKKINNKNAILQKIKDKLKSYKIKYKKIFELHFFIFSINYFFNKYKIDNNKNNEFIEQFYLYNDSIKIIPKKEFYYYHHMLFLERPNFSNDYFNKMKKNMNLKKLDIYQNQRKKECKLEQINNNNEIQNENENENKKIFDTNVLETIENYSTTMTQEPMNEKNAILTPFEIFKRCEDSNRQNKNLQNQHDQRSIITFSESEISCKSKNIPDESIISVVKELSEKPNKFKINKQEKKYTNFFIKKKAIQKLEKNNKNIINLNKNNKNNNVNNNFNNKNNNKNNIINANTNFNNINNNIHNNLNNNLNNNINNNNNNNEEKEVINKKRMSTSTNKKQKKINFDMAYQNTLSKSTSKRLSFINNALSNKVNENKKTNFTSFGTTTRKNKGVLNLKKESYKIKVANSQFKENYIINDNSILNNNINSINNVNSNTNSTLVSTSFNNIDSLLNFFLTPKNKNNNNLPKSKYEEFNKYKFKKRQIKKNTTLTIVNNNIINNSQNSQEKYNNNNNSNFKSKSPLVRLFLKNNEYRSNSKKNNIYKKKKSVLVCELEHNSQITKSVNKFFFEKKAKNMNEIKNISSNNIYNSTINSKNKRLNILALSQAIGSNRKNSYQFMKVNKQATKSNLFK